jgi:hypothetical protein
MKILNFYEIMKWDGGDRHYGTGICFEEESAAEDYLKGNRYDTYQECTFRLYDSKTEVEEIKRQEARAKALAKLTKEERELLGLE